MISLNGLRVVITGAESGIGRAISLACAVAGASVCAAGLDNAGLSATIELIEAGGGINMPPSFAMRTDIREPDQVEALFRRARERFGGVDAVVANAGVIPQLCAAHETSVGDWKATLDTNLTGTFLTVTAAARHLIEQGRGGSIIATGSSTAIRPIAGALAYIASKGGVHAMMQALALELGPHQIRVNTLVPGQTATEPLRAMPGYLEKAASALPLREVAQPDEIARYVAFVLSDAVPHLTGTHLKVDSGRTTA